MLWNWSLWDYFKKESISWSYEFLTSPNWLNIDPKKIAVTVFEWDENAPKDEESANIWKSLWVNNISYLWKKDNWWAPAGTTWPCWPDTEIFYWVGKTEFPLAWSTVWNDEKNWMEIWNNVFMEYIKNENWEFLKAKMQNVDTGMGLERITRTLAWAPSVYETDIFADIIETICETLWVKYNEETKTSIRIIADHTRTAVIMISDWITPSNVDQWYILRRLLRRAIRQWYKLWNSGQFLNEVAKKVIEKFSQVYTNILEKKDIILEEINGEEKQFLSTLEKWLKELHKLIQKKWQHWLIEIKDANDENKFKSNKSSRYTLNELSGKEVFDLFQTYWFPFEMIQEELKNWIEFINISWEKHSTTSWNINKYEFDEAFKKHQELSRIGAEQKFKWWLADNSETTTALHSATHLMLAGLRKILWNHVHQAGSNITSERLRFDFTHPDKVTIEQLKEVEDYVNEAILKNAQVILVETPKNIAKENWVEWSFWEKYPDIVKVYTFTSDNWNIYSSELCWWPHVESTWNMGKFKILKEEASSRWVRRIKAVLEK